MLLLGFDLTLQEIFYRVRYSYRRTARAVLNTSFSTGVAFLAQSISPLMPIGEEPLGEERRFLSHTAKIAAGGPVCV